ncbi:hypothetical protein IH992_17390 [Candidatus Poribacteria bacterium]|nr:hypothetical protein [Candidatus Poribacteria bacterium]
MFTYKNHTLASPIIILIVMLASFQLGCSDRDDISEVQEPDPALQQASVALNRAEAAMEKAGVDINFSDVGSLANLSAILPSPLELAVLEDQGALQEAIGALYEVLDAVGENVPTAQAPANPAQEGFKISDPDLALVHIHLGYLYVLEAVRILTREGWGKDGVPETEDDLFRIAFPENPELENLTEVYQFELTERGQTKFDEIENNPSSRLEDYLKEFRASQRQAILDALVLLVSARVKVSAFPDVNDIDGQRITEQRPQVNRAICRQDALFHLERALDKAEEIAPDLADEFDEFNEIIAEAFAEDFLNQTSQWGFEIENADEVLARINRLIEKR